MKASATLECLPLVGEMEERNLQSFFPFLRLLEEEDLRLEEKEEAFPDADLDDWESVHLADCFLRANWVN